MSDLLAAVIGLAIGWALAMIQSEIWIRRKLKELVEKELQRQIWKAR